jgi:hypothetical protein
LTKNETQIAHLSFDFSDHDQMDERSGWFLRPPIQCFQQQQQTMLEQ